MQNSNSKYYLAIIGALLAIVVILVVLVMSNQKSDSQEITPLYDTTQEYNPIEKDNEGETNIQSQNTTYSPATDPRITGFKENLISISVVPDSSVSGIFTIYGTVTKDFYDQMDGISVVFLDSNNSLMTDSSTGVGLLWTPNEFAVTRRTSTEVSFSVMVDASDATKGPGYISIAQSDGASGRAKRLSIPVVFQ